MRNPRIYQQSQFAVNETVTLSDDAFGHVVRVLRLKNGDTITMFNGSEPIQYTTTLCNVSKK